MVLMSDKVCVCDSCSHLVMKEDALGSRGDLGGSMGEDGTQKLEGPEDPSCWNLCSGYIVIGTGDPEG